MEAIMFLMIIYNLEAHLIIISAKLGKLKTR